MKAQWQRRDPVDVPDLDTLDNLLDGLHDTATANGQPVAVSLYHQQPGPVLVITIGAEHAAAEWCQLPHGPAMMSLAPPDIEHPDSPGLTVDFGGQPSTVPSQRLFPTETARAAARTFLTTGQRPNEIPWPSDRC